MLFRKILAIAVLAAVVSCDSSSDEDAGDLVEFEVLAIGESAGVNDTARLFQVIESQEEYERQLTLFPQELPALVDFDNGLVLFASYGTAPDIARSIEIVSVIDRGRYSLANVILTTSFGCEVGTALSNPYHFIYIPKPISQPILVVETMQDNCQ